MSTKKEEVNKSEPDKDYKKTTTIIETTYEKVLSIINKVKEFIKKNSSKAEELVEDLDWVIKVITNKSLYTYELQKEKLSKQNAEYKTFINFVTKYNEEVIEMNKRHDIVSSIFNLGRKGEILMKPSMCLKRVLPGELKNVEEEKEWGKTDRQKNFINVFGQQILNLYHQEMEKRKKRKSCEFIENSESILGYKKNNMPKEQEESGNYNSNSGNSIDKGNSEIEIKNKQEINLKNAINNVDLKKMKSIRKESLNKNGKDKKANTIIINGKDKDKDTNIQRIKLTINKSLPKSKKNSLQNKQNSNLNSNSSLEKLYGGGVTKLIKSEVINLKNIKKSMKTYMSYVNKDLKMPNVQQYIFNNNNIINNYNNRYLYKTDYNININYNNNYNYDINKPTSKKNKNSIEKGFMIYKNYKYGSFPYNMSKSKIKGKSINKKIKGNNSTNKNLRNLKTNFILNTNENQCDIFTNDSNKYYLNKNINNYNINKRFSKKIQITAENKKSYKDIKDNKDNNIMYNNIYSIKTKINNLNINSINTISTNRRKYTFESNVDSNKSENKDIKEDNKSSENENKYNIRSLVEKYFEDAKMIVDKDFNIFDFQDKVGYQNVLPIMGFIIMKTLGLVDKKIISVKKLDSFLFTVSNNYKQTTLYHNALHGSDVTQSICCYFLNSNIEEICETNVLDLLGMMVSAMGHDLGHPGLNNNFHINDSSDLAITYNDVSVLENYHSSFLFKILRKEENNIIEKFSTHNYKTLRKRMISQILATDMANHGEVISSIRSKINTWKESGQSRFILLSGNEKTKFDEQQSLLNYIIHMADLGHNCKKFNISLQWVKLLSMEFWDQGDKEKEKGLPVSFLCDRNKVDIPSSQIGFIKGFIASSFDCLVSIFPKLKYTMENAQDNIDEWKKLKEAKRLRGWTPQKEKEKEKEKEINNSDYQK